jgi:pyrimidine deaminase RibD-like protein
MHHPRRSSEPVPLERALADVMQAMTGVTLPEPCSHCGWQYPLDVLVKAARREVVLDDTPTHLCQPPLA